MQNLKNFDVFEDGSQDWNQNILDVYIKYRDQGMKHGEAISSTSQELELNDQDVESEVDKAYNSEPEYSNPPGYDPEEGQDDDEEPYPGGLTADDYEEDDDTWTDPAGGIHHGDEDDPAAMYENLESFIIKLTNGEVLEKGSEILTYPSFTNKKEEYWIFSNREEAEDILAELGDLENDKFSGAEIIPFSQVKENKKYDFTQAAENAENHAKKLESMGKKLSAEKQRKAAEHFRKRAKEEGEVNESETSEYRPPNNVVKVPDGDTGFNLVRKNYKRFIWTWESYNKNNPPNITNE